MQSSSFYAINESKEGIKNCDIFNNLTANMKHISAGSFHKYDQILKIGDRVSSQVLPELVKLSNTQKKENLSFIKQPLIFEERPILINNIIIDTMSHLKQKKFISNKLNIQPGDVVHYKDLEKAVTKIYSNRNLLKAYYSIQPTDSAGNVIKFKVLEDAKFRFKGALHFDSELGAGFILNFTMRNVIGKNSRLVATVDLAQSPRYRIHYRKYLCNTPLSFNVQLYREKVAFNLYNQQGRGEDVFMNLYRSFDVGLNYALGVNTSIYAGYQANINKYSPKFSDSNQAFTLKDYQETYEGSVFQFKYNTVDRRFFSRKGIDFRVEDRYSFYTVQELKAQEKDIFTDSVSEIVSKNYTNPFNSLNVKLNVFLPISKKLTLSLKMNTGLIAENVVKQKINPRDTSYTVSNISTFQQFRIGGVDSRFRDNYVSFYGVKEGEFFANSFSSVQMALQYEVKSNLFLTPFFSYCYSAPSLKNYLANYKNISLKNESLYKNPNYSTIYTYGLNVGYKTPLGPLMLSVSKPSIVSNLRYYLSFGYNF
jgi:NTE family protein